MKYPRCDEECPGWAVFNAGTHPEVQRCDDCNKLQGDDPMFPTDLNAAAAALQMIAARDGVFEAWGKVPDDAAYGPDVVRDDVVLGVVMTLLLDRGPSRIDAQRLLDRIREAGRG